MPILKEILIVALGGGAGAAARFGVGVWSLRALGPGFPWGTLIVNIAGSFLIGCMVAFAVHRGEPTYAMRLLLVTGFLGGFTTFSAFSLDTLALAQRGELGTAFGYVAASLVLSLGACWGGMMLSRSFS